MTLLDRMVNPGNPIFYSRKYRQMIEDHINFLRKNKTVTVVSLDPMVSFKYLADFYGLLFYLTVPMQYHYAVLRLNGYKNPSDFKGTETSINMVDTEVIRLLVNTLKTQAKKTNK